MPCTDAAAWQAAVAAMVAELEARHWRDAGLNVTLRGNLVRYLVLPQVENLNERDALVYAQESFADRYGAPARDWAVCVSASGSGLSRVAAAADRALIEAFKAHARDLRLKMRSVRPALSAAVQDLARVDRDFTGWLAMIDAGHSCVARLSKGSCVTIRAARFGESAEQHLLTQLEQDALCAGLDAAASEVYIHCGLPFEHATLHAHGWRAALLPAAPLPTLAAS